MVNRRQVQIKSASQEPTILSQRKQGKLKSFVDFISVIYQVMEDDESSRCMSSLAIDGLSQAFFREIDRWDLDPPRSQL
jgi:hypothetical protein